MKSAECCRLAEFFKLFSNPVRLGIICALSKQEKTASALAEELAISKHYLSQQIKMLRLLKILDQEKRGRFIFYSIKDKELTQLFKQISNNKGLKKLKVHCS